jgi:hypothetical protein
MEPLKRLFLIGLVNTSLSLVGMAGTCQTETANNIAADDGCTVTVGSEIFSFGNFTFTPGTVTAPGGFAAIDNTISFSTYFEYRYPAVIVTDTGDSLWNISSGQWGFTFAYDVGGEGLSGITDFWADEGGASATGTGGSSTTETCGGMTSIATTADPTPAHSRYFGGSVIDVVVNNAGSGTSDLTSVSNTFETPEPATAVLFGLGLLALGLKARSPIR